jgi:hypothetical protein
MRKILNKKFIYLISFTVRQPYWLPSQKKQTYNETGNYETDEQKTNFSILSGGFYPFCGRGPMVLQQQKHVGNNKKKKKKTEKKKAQHKQNKTRTAKYTLSCTMLDWLINSYVLSVIPVAYVLVECLNHEIPPCLSK